VLAIEGVSYDEPLLSFTAVLDATAGEPLVAAVLDPAKWTARYGGVRYVGYSAEVTAFDRVAVIVESGPAEAGADEVGYTNAPSDVVDTLGRTLAAFAWEL
jgi:hypothetical protein